jgi:hypothetical protein
LQKKVVDRLTQYYRCPERFAEFGQKAPLSDSNGYFRFGERAVCFGRYSGEQSKEFSRESLRDAVQDITVEDGANCLPFDPSQAADNLLCELYVEDWRKATNMSAIAEIYYLLRPLLPVRVRRLLQRVRLAGWEKMQFPQWPVDFSVDGLFEQLLVTSLKSPGIDSIPFIWFWPQGASSCAIMTHDVETERGRRFCETLMDINDSFGIKSSFQVIPEQRYQVSPEYLDSIRNRGFEVAVHDLNHDGHLYRDREQFLKRAEKINVYGKEYGASGFRAGVLYRKQIWFDALHFSYDMSVPNVAHLDPQRGGCCTVMPYFIGDILEIPVTTTQDYTLFHIFSDYSTDLWRRQTELIMQQHGLMSFIVHPDYIMEEREQRVYKELLGHLANLRKSSGVWIATPAELNTWWRQRAEMKLVQAGSEWRIEGAGKERAQVAYATLKAGKLAVEFQSRRDQSSCPVGRIA